MKLIAVGLLFTMALVLAMASTTLAGDAPATKETFGKEIGFQIELIKKGDLEKLRHRFTARQKDKITKQMLARAKKEVASYTVAELVHEVAPGQYKGQKTAKIKMKNGRTLTTFVLVDGAWLADTLWFK